MEITNRNEIEAKAKKLILKRIDIEKRAERILGKEIYKIFLKALSVAKFDSLERNNIQLVLKEKMLSEGFKSSEMEDLFAQLRNILFTVMETSEDRVRELYNKEFDTGFAVLPEADEYKGRTPGEILASHSGKVAGEFKTWMMVGLVLSVPAKKLSGAYRMYMRSPYTNPLFEKAAEMLPAVITRPVKGSVGVYTSGLNSVLRTVRYDIADASRRYFAMTGVQKFLVGRGSDYPCPLCEDMVGIRTASELPPYHNRCRCWCYPIN